MVNASKSRFLNLPRLNPDVRLGRLPSASTRITEMNECENSGLFPLVLVSERNNEIAVLPIPALSQARGNLGLDAVDDLPVQRRIIVREIDILF